jgi:broad specificity phosphatase PhoE
MQNLYFIRHGQTEWNAIRRMQGQWNSNLNEAGRGHADINGQLLAKLNIDALYVSPLDRTRQTAEIINQYLNLEPIFDDRIKEWHCGDWSGEMYAEIPNKWPKEWQQMEDDRFYFRPPNGENYPDMFERAKPFVEELLASTQRNIAIVSHGMIGKVMFSYLMGYEPQEVLAVHQDNDMVFKVTIDGDERHIEHFLAGKGPIAGLPFED